VAHPSPLIAQLSHHVILFPFFLPSFSIVASICSNPKPTKDAESRKHDDKVASTNCT
jgi:hypothetical protein